MPKLKTCFSPQSAQRTQRKLKNKEVGRQESAYHCKVTPYEKGSSLASKRPFMRVKKFLKFQKLRI